MSSIIFIYSVWQACEGRPAGSSFYMRISVRGTVLIQGVAQIPLSSTFVLGSPCSNLLWAGPCNSWAPARNTKISEGCECHTGTNNQEPVLYHLEHVRLTARRATCNRTGLTSKSPGNTGLILGTGGTAALTRAGAEMVAAGVGGNGTHLHDRPAARLSRYSAASESW